MDSRANRENTSTPKRRRLGTGRILRPTLKINNKENNASFSNFSPIHRQITSTKINLLERCESPPLPSNQDEFLHDSRNNSSICNKPPNSPAVFENSPNNSIVNNSPWESLSTTDLGLGNMGATRISTQNVLNAFKDISDDMFHSRMEQESSQVLKGNVEYEDINCTQPKLEQNQNHADDSVSSNHESSFVSGQAILDLITGQKHNNTFTMGCEKEFMKNVEESFELVNQSICRIEADNKKSEKSCFFETKDSFLLDIKETGLIKPNIPERIYEIDSFYGLPVITKSLFQTYRNIEKFYDWQEECLNLPAIKERRNLIYALPTSGGKTLVAEVLMLQEVLNRKNNALFILPFVAIVQEKIFSLSPFALNLDFLVEEYAGGKGLIPPKKRRKKSVYVATIEKGLGLIRSLIELNRLDEIGLIVVDELHLIGEQGRGATLETLLTTVLFADKGIQIIGMSATIGNLPQLAQFLRADVFERQFRPVELTEYVKLGDVLYKMQWTKDGLDITPDRQLSYAYSAEGAALDPDRLGGLVAEVVPEGCCLVFCPTRHNCESVALLLSKLQRRDMMNHRVPDRESLERALRSEGASSELIRMVRCGVAYHHAGLAGDERALLETAFRSGVISVLCCTSTLAAGVNLPARRVLVRAPRVGRAPLTLAAYRQMAGRAGRAGVCETGESILICEPREWESVREMFRGGMPPATSQLAAAGPALLLSAVALQLASTRAAMRRLLACTLLATSPDVNLQELCDESIKSLIQSGALEVVTASKKRSTDDEYVISDSTEFVVSKLGVAAIKGCMDLSTAKQFLTELKVSSRGLVLLGGLHLLYLVTPDTGDKPDYRNYYTLYDNLDEEGIRTARALGITEENAVRMMTGKPITKVLESVLVRFYLALMLRDLWRQVPFAAVADKYCLPRGTVQGVMASSAAFAANAQKLCEALHVEWFPPLLGEMAARLRHCAAPELQQLMELPGVKKARAMQLVRAGYKRIEQLARASADELLGAVDHLSRTAATQLVSAAKMMLIEKVENLRAEAEEVMEDLKM